MLKYQKAKKILFHLGYLHVGMISRVVVYGNHVLTVVVYAHPAVGVR